MLLDDIGTALEVAQICKSDGTSDWMLYKGFMLDQPDRAICIYETPGTAPEEQFAIDYPDFQIRVRGNPNDYKSARHVIQRIFNALHAQETNIGAAYVFCYAKQSGPMSMGRDEKMRPHLVWNYRVMKDRWV